MSSTNNADSDDEYEPEYEWEQVHVANNIQIVVLSVLPPPLEFMSTLHTNQQEISGRQVWTGSLALANVLCECEQAKKDLFENRILELGSGTGILGMTIAHIFHPKCVVLTDGDEKALDLLQSNLEHKNNSIVSAIVKTTMLRWGEESEGFVHWCRSSWPHCWKKNGAVCFDAIVAGDVMYKEELPPLFFRTVKQLLAPNAALWLCHIPRSTVTHEIVQTTARTAGFRLETIAFDSKHIQGCPVEDVSRAQIYRMTNDLIA